MRTTELHRRPGHDHDGHDHDHPHGHDHDHPHGHDHGSDHGHAHDQATSTGWLSRRGGRAVVVAATVTAVIGTVMVTRANGSSSSTSTHVAPPIPAAAEAPSAVTIPSLNDPAAAASGAPSARDAVTQFLDAEIAGDAERSFGLLSLADRTQFGSAQAWMTSHDQLPVYLSYTVTESNSDRIVTDVTLEPQLDEIVGFVPARAIVTWQAGSEDGSWHVALDRSESVAVLPSPDAIAAAANAWVGARQKCTVSAQYEGSLLGQPSVAEGLCGGSGTYTPSSAKTIDAFPDPSPITTAFGSDASAWVRVVDMTGPNPFTLALAPLGDQWVVVAVARR